MKATTSYEEALKAVRGLAVVDTFRLWVKLNQQMGCLPDDFWGWLKDEHPDWLLPPRVRSDGYIMSSWEEGYSEGFLIGGEQKEYGGQDSTRPDET